MADPNNPFKNSFKDRRIYTSPGTKSVTGGFSSVDLEGGILPGLTKGFELGKPPGAIQRQPDNVNYLFPNYFKFNLFRLPKMIYFVQKANLPQFGTDGNLIQPNRFVNAKHPNTKATFGDITLSFLVDEDMANYRELYNWMRTIYLIKHHKEFDSDIKNHFSDGSLHILNSAMLPKQEIRFHNMLPIQISGLDFDSSITDLTPLVADITFAYDYYEFV
jgi:hypothetical protein